MTEITEVVPSRIRAGEAVVINGSAFSPSFGQNSVLIGGLSATILSESEFQILVEVPGGIPSDAYVAIQVQRNDNFDNDVLSVWSAGDAADLASGVTTIPGQVPGPEEAEDPAFLEDTPQAQDFERMATLAEFLVREVWGAKGDLLSHDGVSPLQLEPVGLDGQVLTATPAAARGLSWGAVSRKTSLSWGKQIDAANVLNGPMVANGDALSASVADGDQPVGQAGTITSLAVLVQLATAGDTLDQVQIFINGALAFDSTGGQAIAQGSSYTSAPGVAVLLTDRVSVLAFKAGTAGPMSIRARLVVE